MQLHASGAHAVSPATDVSYVNGWEEIDPLSRVEMIFFFFSSGVAETALGSVLTIA